MSKKGVRILASECSAPDAVRTTLSDVFIEKGLDIKDRDCCIIIHHLSKFFLRTFPII